MDISTLDRSLTDTGAAGMAAGLDLGATWSKLAWADQSNQASVQQQLWWPTVLGYDRDGAPFTDRAERPDPPASWCALFTTRLAGSSSGLARAEWGGRTASTVLRDYLTSVLRSGPALSALTVAMPRSWLIRSADGPATADLIADLLKSPALRYLPDLVNAPIAAAAYFGYRYPELAADGPMLLCDAGARTFTASLCYTRSGRVREADRQSVTAASQAYPVPLDTFVDWALREAAARADRPVIPRAVFERALADPGAERGYEVLDAAAAYPSWRDTGAFDCDGARLSAGDLLDGFRPAAAQIKGAVASLLIRRRELEALTGAGCRLVLYGGLSGFQPIRAAILEACGVAEAAVASPAGPAQVVHLADSVERRFATALGAALMATGRVDAIERHPQAVAIRVQRIEAGLLKPSRLVLAPAGTVSTDAGGGYTAVRDQAAPTPVVQVRRSPGEGDARLPVELRSAATAEFQPVGASPGGYPPSGTYRVTAESDQDGNLCVAFDRLPSDETAGRGAAPERYVHVLASSEDPTIGP